VSSWLARVRGDLDYGIAVVVFTKPERDLRLMDVDTGPCVPTGGRKRALVGPTRQDLGETPRHTAALLTALTGEAAEGALEVVARRGKGVLHVCTERFVNAMADARAELSRLAEQDKAQGADNDLWESRMVQYDSAWRMATDWPRLVTATSHRLDRLWEAQKARVREQPLYCWHGPTAPMYRVVSRDRP
jgi:hypothetical protein